MLKKLLFVLFLTPMLLSAVKVKIVCTADLHGNIPAFAALATTIKAENPDIYCDCGDLYGGNYFSDFDNGRSMVEALNLLNCDAWVIGNHEFENSFADLRDLFSGFHGKVLGNWTSGQLPMVEPYTILNRRGMTIAIVGMGDLKQSERLLPQSDFQQPDDRRFLYNVLKEIREKHHPDMVILACHRGMYSDKGYLGNLLCNFPEIRLVLGAHTHKENAGEKVAFAYFVQPASHARSAIKVEVDFDEESRRIRRIESVVLYPDSAKPYQPVLKLYETLKPVALAAGAKKIAHYTGILRQPEPRKINTAFAQLGAEALKESVNADYGVFVCGTGRKSQSAEITIRDIYNLYPYKSEVIVAKLHRTELYNFLLEEIANSNRQKYYYVSGFAGLNLRGGTVEKESLPEISSVAIGSYRFCMSPALAAVRRDPSRWKRGEVSERQAICDYLMRHYEIKK